MVEVNVLLSLLAYCNCCVTCHGRKNIQQLSQWEVKMDSYVTNALLIKIYILYM